jgi:phage protein U
MYAQLGNIVFINLKGFTDYNKTGSATYAEHKLLTGKPRLQPTGPTLDELTVSMRFHASFCVPINELNALKQCRDSNTVLPLILGNGTLEGNFVITDINDVVEDADNQGNVFSYMVNCTLKEYVVPDQLQAEQNTNRQNAAAVGNVTPVAKPKTNLPTCPQLISQYISGIKSHAGTINTIILLQGGITPTANKNSVIGHLSVIQSLAQSIIANSNNPSSCAYTQDGLGDAATEVYNVANDWQVNDISDDLTAPDDNSSLQDAVANLESVATPLIQQSITGQV